MFEHRRQPVAPRPVFYARLRRSFALACGIVLTALGLGILGYHWFERMPWVDAFVNAAMILSGMGPVGTLQTTPGKLFAGCYALFSGLVFITATGVIFAPLFHRFIHKFHFDTENVHEKAPKQDKAGPIRSVSGSD